MSYTLRPAGNSPHGDSSVPAGQISIAIRTQCRILTPRKRFLVKAVWVSQKIPKKLSKFENLLLFTGSESWPWHIVLTTESTTVQCSKDPWVASQSCHPPNVHRTPFPFSLQLQNILLGRLGRQIIFFSGTLTGEGLGNRNPGKQLGSTMWMQTKFVCILAVCGHLNPTKLACD